MLYTQTVEKLHSLRLEGMVHALEEQRQQKDIVELDFEARTVRKLARVSKCLNFGGLHLKAILKMSSKNAG
jgi:predicted membrane metal-binding protein